MSCQSSIGEGSAKTGLVPLYLLTNVQRHAVEFLEFAYRSRFASTSNFTPWVITVTSFFKTGYEKKLGWEFLWKTPHFSKWFGQRALDSSAIRIKTFIINHASAYVQNRCFAYNSALSANSFQKGIPRASPDISCTISVFGVKRIHLYK